MLEHVLTGAAAGVAGLALWQWRRAQQQVRDLHARLNQLEARAPAAAPVLAEPPNPPPAPPASQASPAAQTPPAPAPDGTPAQRQVSAPAAGLPLGAMAPDFTLPDLYGTPQTLSHLRGHAILLVFVAPTCPYSQGMVPDLKRLMTQRQATDPFPVLVTTGDRAANVARLDAERLPLPVLLQRGNELSTMFQATGTPMGYGIDRNGRIATPLLQGVAPLLAVGSRALEPVEPMTYRGTNEPVLAGLPVGTPAPDFVLETLGGARVSMLEGPAQKRLLVFLDAFGKSSLDLLTALHRGGHLSDPALRVVLLCGGPATAVERALLDIHLDLPVLLTGPQGVASAYGVPQAPCAVGVDAQGRVCTPIAAGLDPVLGFAAGLRAEARHPLPALALQAPIVCRVDAPPAGSAVNRIYARSGVQFVKGDGPWQLWRPMQNQIFGPELAALGDCAGKWIESVPGMDMLATRRPLWHKLVQAVGRARAGQVMAETFVLNDPADLQALAASGPEERFVLKSYAQRRRGIKLASGPEAVEAKDDYLVAERFIQDQLRFRGTTFHLRCYLLLQLRQGVLGTWLYRDALCGWALPGAKASSEFEEWITHPDNVVPDDYPSCLSELCPALSIDLETTWQRIAQQAGTLVNACAGRAPEVTRAHGLEGAWCFQHFGMDVLLESSGSVRVCEVNALPEMDARNPRFAKLKDRVVFDGLVATGLLPGDHGFRQIQ